MRDDAGDTQFRITADPVLTLRGQIALNEERFRFTDEGFEFRGVNMTYRTIDCANQGYVAMDVKEEATDLNFGGATIRVIAPSPHVASADTTTDATLL